MRKYRILCIGEILWDIIEGEKHLGGAPFNLGCFVNYLGHEGMMLSRVGKDSLGEEILEHLARMGFDSRLIQRDEEHPTGTVLVTLDKEGVPDYRISEDVAYDYIELDEALLDSAGPPDAVCFGTVAQRSSRTREAILRTLEHASGALAVYDINLRQDFYSEDIIRRSLEACDVLKLNEEECDTLAGLLGAGGTGRDEFVRDLLERFSLKLVCLTCGERGCSLDDGRQHVYSAGYRVRVEDTVGSGDAFTAALVTRYLAGASLERIADFSNLVGAYVASKRGAVPQVTEEALEEFRAGSVLERIGREER